MSQTIASLQKALDVVDELANYGSDIGVSELARRLGLTKNQVFRILKTLEAYGYVHQLNSKTYRLGFKFFEIGQRTISQHDLVNVAAPLMDGLRDATGESVHLFVRDGLEAVCLARRESTALISLSARVGKRFLLHAGACPKAILAFQPPAVIDAVIALHGLPQYTNRTIVARQALLDHLTKIREQGFAESDEDLDVGAYAIAIPLYDSDGAVNAAISVAGPAHRFAPPARAHALALLQETSCRIAAALGVPATPATQALLPPEQRDQPTDQADQPPGMHVAPRATTQVAPQPEWPDAHQSGERP